jgi:hypothetical protein
VGEKVGCKLFLNKSFIVEGAGNNEVLVKDKIFAGIKKKTVEFLNKAVK